MRLAPALISLLAASCLAACDPCSGVLACGGPELRYEGAITQRYTNAPLANALVRFVRADGARLERDTIEARTDAFGYFSLASGASSSGAVRGGLIVQRADGIVIDSADDVSLQALRPNSSAPFVVWRLPRVQVGRYGILLWRGTERRAAGVRVEFRRTRGVPAAPESFVATTDSIGQFAFGTTPLAEGELVGELSFQPPAPYRPERYEQVRFRATAAEGDQEIAGVWIVGPYFPYTGLLVWGDTKQIASGVEVEFRRTGGVPISPERVVMTSNANPFGNVRLLPVTPLGDGEVIGDLTIRPPAPYRTLVIRDLHVPTSTEDVPYHPVLKVWEIPRD